jgi:signal transduction histidine kinase
VREQASDAGIAQASAAAPRPASAVPLPGRPLTGRAPIGMLVGVFVVCLVWTVLILATPSFGFVGDWPSARVPIETAGALVGVLVATLAYFRYSYTGVPALLLVALAFLVLTINQFVFGVVISPIVIARDLNVYIWTSGRIVAGSLLLAGTLPRFRMPTVRKHPLIDLAAGIAGVVGLIGLGPIIVSAVGSHLQPVASALSRETADTLTGARSDLTAPDLVLGLLGAAIFFLAAFRYASAPATGEPALAVLVPALVLAAFSHLHYMLTPTVFSDRISTGDLLSVAFLVVVFVGLMWDVRAAYLAERQRAGELQSAFAMERRRADDLERIDRARADLFRLVSHELMHPVAAVRGWIVTLERRWDELDDHRKLEIVKRLDAETERLRDLAEQAPDAADVRAVLEPVLPRRERVVELIEEAIGGASERVHVFVDNVARDASVRADGARILQVLRNLLTNAARHGGDAPAQLSVFADGREVLFEVTDFGPGIPAADLPHVFEQGYRGSAATAPGAGLGLFICKGIVESHGGTITAESVPGVRTTFRFSLPRWVHV